MFNSLRFEKQHWPSSDAIYFKINSHDIFHSTAALLS